LKFIKKTTMPKLIENAQMLATATRAAVTALGLGLFSSAPGSSVTTVLAPAGMDSGVIVKEFKSRFGAIIANGQGSMQGKLFRFAHLGYFDFADVFAIIACLEIILHENGFPVKFGSGVAAAQEVYAKAVAASKAKAAVDNMVAV
jgi:aspartate aminotransferase-like enzyme